MNTTTVVVDNSTSWSDPVVIAAIVLAVITLAAVVLAFFQEPIKRWLSRAKLRIVINTEPPDTHQIALTDPNGNQNWGIYVRVRVEHRDGPAADNVEIMITRLWDKTKQGYIERTSFLPLPLVWSHYDPPRSNLRVPVGLFRHCDLGCFRENPFNQNNETILVLSTLVNPNPVGGATLPPNVIEHGEYQFELTLVGDNVKPMTRRWTLKFEQNWSDDEATMLGRISIAPVG